MSRLRPECHDSKKPALSDDTALYLIRESVAKRRELIHGRLDGPHGSHCAIGSFSRPVVNPPADEAEARNRVHAAPGQADRDAARRGKTGPSSRPEARPVMPTAHDWVGPYGFHRHVHCAACGKIFEIGKAKGLCYGHRE